MKLEGKALVVAIVVGVIVFLFALSVPVVNMVVRNNIIEYYVLSELEKTEVCRERFNELTASLKQCQYWNDSSVGFYIPDEVAGLELPGVVLEKPVKETILDLEVEERLVPEVKIGVKESAELEKIRKEIKQGKTISEKELFSILSK